MSEYNAPLKDMKFAMKHVAGFDSLENMTGFSDTSWDTTEAVLEEAAKLAAGVLGPLNVVGDQIGAKMIDGKVVFPDGFQEAYDVLAEGGWISLTAPEQYGGMEFPETVGAAVSEMWQGSNLGFSLGILLAQGASAALIEHASDEIKDMFVPKMLSGEWAGTMNLTEPQAGSDLGALRSKALLQDDGSYLISGNKIFISYGDHELTDNIVHLVLARTQNAPAGPKGISLFVVPKFLPDENGNLGKRNDLRCVSLEHKLGIHVSPTAVMSFGDNEGAKGWIVGEENQGLKYMFVMMNRARFEVGLQGVGVAERAYQRARDYALERVQGRAIGKAQGHAIIGHPDVRRMLMLMKSQTEATRALCYDCAMLLDTAHHATDQAERDRANADSQFMTPIVKAWVTEVSVEVASLGVQVHGGLGYIEETGAAQHLRDARILTIYEGTTGIQASDLVFRKLLLDGGVTASRLMLDVATEISTHADTPEMAGICNKISASLEDARKATGWMLATADKPQNIAAGVYPYLRLMGALFGGQMMMRSAAMALVELNESDADTAFLNAKIATAKFYADHVLCATSGFYDEIANGADSVFGLSDEQF